MDSSYRSCMSIVKKMKVLGGRSYLAPAPRRFSLLHRCLRAVALPRAASTEVLSKVLSLNLLSLLGGVQKGITEYKLAYVLPSESPTDTLILKCCTSADHNSFFQAEKSSSRLFF